MIEDVWTVHCDNARSGDVIEHPVTPVTSSHGCITAAFAEASRWYRSGPNGPARTADVRLNGRIVTLSDLQHGPSMPVRLEARRLASGGWWTCAAIRPDGVRLSARHGVSLSVDAEYALLEGHRWAESKGYTVTSEDVRS